MTHQEFILLNDQAQSDTVAKKGVRVADYEEGKYRYSLYQLDAFYLEGKLEIATGNIVGIFSFTSIEPLDKYTNRIKLPD